MRLAILIPCLNEGDRLARFVSELVGEIRAGGLGPPGFECVDVVIVDDGSRVPVQLPSVESQLVRVRVLRHLVNLGQGAALQTALEYARDFLNADLFVTLDADGQHRPQDLFVLLEPLIRKQVDFVFGNRFMGRTIEVPRARKWLLRLATAFEVGLTGIRTHDSHNGFRAFSRKAAQVIELRQNRMAHATEFKQLVATQGLTYREVPVSIRYSAETLEKGQSNWGSLRILKDLLQLYLFDRS